MYTYDFDEIIDRRGTNAVNVELARDAVGGAGTKLPCREEDLIRMWVADMEFAPPPEVIDALRERLERRILGYTGEFDGSLYAAFSGWCESRYGWRFPREQLVYAPGVVAALCQVAEDVTGPGDGILILTPSYSHFADAAERSGAELMCSPMRRENGRYVIDFDDLGKKAADPKAKLLIFCNPHNPTGRAWTREELAAVGDIAEKNGLWLVSDEIHCDLTRRGVGHITMGTVMPDYEKLVVCMSASKTFNLAGLALAETVIRDGAERGRFRTRLLSSGLGPMSMAAHTAAFSRGGPWLEALREYLDGNFEELASFFARRFPAASFTASEATYLAWADMSAYLPGDRRAAAYIAEKTGVVVQDGTSFVGNAEGHIRMNIAMPRALLRQGLDRLAKLP